MTMQHVERRHPLGTTIGLCPVSLNAQPVAVFHQDMPPEAKHGTRA